MVLTSCLPQGEEINHEFPDELYELPPEELQEELNPPGSLAAESQSGTSRQVHRNPRGGRGQCHRWGREAGGSPLTPCHPKSFPFFQQPGAGDKPGGRG